MSPMRRLRRGPSFVAVAIPVLFALLGGAVVLYRVLVRIDDRKGRTVSLVLVICVMLLNELWNYLFFGLRSTLAGFLGMIVFLVPLTALLLALRRYEGFSARLVAAYYVWVLYDLAWAYELWRLNGA
jgi:benzodiazapine receptor